MKRRVLVLLVFVMSCLAATALGWTLSHSALAVGSAEALTPNQGNPVWTPFNVSDEPIRSQQYAEAAANSANGSFFVVWKDASAPSNISGRLVSAAGSPSPTIWAATPTSTRWSCGFWTMRTTARGCTAAATAAMWQAAR